MKNHLENGGGWQVHSFLFLFFSFSFFLSFFLSFYFVFACVSSGGFCFAFSLSFAFLFHFFDFLYFANSIQMLSFAKRVALIKIIIIIKMVFTFACFLTVIAKIQFLEAKETEPQVTPLPMSEIYLMLPIFLRF